ncbi:glycosyltransferase family 25 protein [Pantoea dispersa]|uniref:glycosyltransferase family 25 protein n=1 Tax=Pantoea dispersa TaxID=59814 RepID=UPI00123B6FD8|nr:glycosyltransferase family 25 protein [Pantoea dispersa]KAA8673191.1 glycosyltransferase [Pantoea dispersa]MBS0906811.1 glycosyltransferase family 25 protein [Pantoea dispersa]
MVLNWDLIDKIVYINLKERTVRRSSIEQQLRKLAVPENKIFRFEAKRHLLGHVGCAQSHLAVLEHAITQNWGHVLILEDDMYFNHDAASKAALAYTFDVLPSLQWDVTLLSANYSRVIPFKSTTSLIKPLQAWCACAYLVNKNYLPELRDNVAESVERLLQGGAKHQFAVDVHWMQLMQRGRWLGMYPVVGHQLPGNSDIEGQFRNYKSLFYKDITEIRAEPQQ